MNDPSPLPAIATPVLASLPESRRLILELVKRQGTADAEMVARHLGITGSGARQQLIALERDGMLRHEAARNGPGRPTHRYRLTTVADALFPRAYAELTNELLEYVEDEDPALLERIFDRRAQRWLQRVRGRAADLPFPEQVRAVAALLDEEGYLAAFHAEPDGSFIITEHNCVVMSVALRYRHVCTSELAFLQAALPTATVTRIAHRIDGGHVCAYRVAPAGTPAREPV